MHPRLFVKNVGKFSFGMAPAKLDIAFHNMIDVVQLRGGHLPYLPGGHTSHQKAITNTGTRRDDCTGSHDAPRPHMRSVQDDRSDSDQSPRCHAPAMNDGAMTYDHIVGYLQGDTTLGVQYGAILHIDPPADADRRHIGTDADLVHDRALVTQYDVTTHVGCMCDIHATSHPNSRFRITHGYHCTPLSRNLEPGFVGAQNGNE